MVFVTALKLIVWLSTCGLFVRMLYTYVFSFKNSHDCKVGAIGMLTAQQVSQFARYLQKLKNVLTCTIYSVGRVREIALCWINGKEKSWKLWVENRVVAVKKVVGREKLQFV